MGVGLVDEKESSHEGMPLPEGAPRVIDTGTPSAITELINPELLSNVVHQTDTFETLRTRPNDGGQPGRWQQLRDSRYYDGDQPGRW